MLTEEQKDEIRRLSHKAGSEGAWYQRLAIVNILTAIHDELVYQRGQKETPRPGRQPATTKG